MVLSDLVINETEPQDGKVRVANGVKTSGKLNLGWLMLEAQTGWELKPEQFAKLSDKPSEALASPEIQEILNRAVLVSNKMFSHIVNDNLEVRTSVSIDPLTGAAAEGALYTYEAIPRASVLFFDVVVSDPRFYRIDGEIPLEGSVEKVKSTVENGLALFDSLGIGGMNTRGIGRLRVLNLNAGWGK